MTTTNVVWILGAGFSRSLGGPLLADLFSNALLARSDACFPPNRFFESLATGSAGMVRKLYGSYGPWSATTAERHWKDAEEFLEMLDREAHREKKIEEEFREQCARQGGEAPTDDEIDKLLLANYEVTQPIFYTLGAKCQVRQLAASSRALLAAQCHEFVDRAKPADEERWAPYRRWAGNLSGCDTIVSFNYDLVVEEAMKAIDRQLYTPLPGNPLGLGEDGALTLLKLHGSVDWGRARENGTDLYSKQTPTTLLMSGRSDAIVIATPGPTKANTVASDLEPLWKKALDKIRDAEVIVFIGYRFPPSDSEARTKLLKAIRENRKRYTSVHTVLGDDIQDPATRRMKGLLEATLKQRFKGMVQEAKKEMASGVAKEALKPELVYALANQASNGQSTYGMEVHPLFAQDFLDIYEPGDLVLGR